MINTWGKEMPQITVKKEIPMTKTQQTEQLLPMIEDFKQYLVASMNEDVYYQLKSYLENADIEDEDYSEALDFMVANIHGSQQWVEG